MLQIFEASPFSLKFIGGFLICTHCISMIILICLCRLLFVDASGLTCKGSYEIVGLEQLNLFAISFFLDLHSYGMNTRSHQSFPHEMDISIIPLLALFRFHRFLFHFVLNHQSFYLSNYKDLDYDRFGHITFEILPFLYNLCCSHSFLRMTNPVQPV